MKTVAEENDDGDSRLPEKHSRINALRRYAVAILLAGLAFGIRYELESILGRELPFMLFTAAALIATWYGGATAGFVALGLGLFLGEFFFQALRGGIESLETFRFLRYVFTGALGIILIELLRRGEHRAKAAAEELGREVERRKRSEAALQAAKDLLSRHANELEDRVAERTAELSASIESLEGILYHIGHNLRAPLRSMGGFTMLLKSGYGQSWDADANDYARRISTSAKQMERLIQDLLDYGRLTHVSIRLSDFSLEDTIDRAISQLAAPIEFTRAEILVDRPLPSISADSNVLNQVLVHLLENAIKFVAARTRPRIHLWAERRNTMIRLWIQDNGIGIEPRFHDRIFRPFERHEVVEGHEGQGIGLAIVKEGVQRMEGRTGAESQLGAGSRFWIELPASSAISEKVPRPQPLDLERQHVETIAGTLAKVSSMG